MRIAYLIRWNEGPKSGVFKKVVSQVTEWVRQGHEVGLFLFTNNSNNEWESYLQDVQVTVQTYRRGLGRFSDFRVLIQHVEEWNPTVIYHRYDLFYFGLPELLRKIPSVLEINTNDMTEMRLGNKLKYMYHALTRDAVLHSTSGYVFVSGEIALTENFRRQAKDTTVIGNSIALHDFAQAPPAHNKEPRLIFIGTPGLSWHGVDAIALMAKEHSNWHFDIIGVPSTEIKKPIPSNMIFHGKLTRAEYEPLMHQADVAIGSLALYRKKMGEASPLKVREYLAYGLPVINGYLDTDFPEEVHFILQIPNEPKNTIKASEAIEKFVQSWRGRRVDRSQIEHLDTVVKEAERLRYMKRITEKGGIR